MRPLRQRVEAIARRSRSAQIALAVGWLIALEVPVLFAVYPYVERLSHRSMLAGVAVQVAAYALVALPVIAVAPGLLNLYRRRWNQWLAGLLLLSMSFLYVMSVGHMSLTTGILRLVQQLSTGFAEETVFRGFVFAKGLAFQRGVQFAVAVTSVLFALIHIPQVIYLHDTLNAALIELLVDLTIGTFLCLVRYWTKALVLPSLLHAAINLPGV